MHSSRAKTFRVFVSSTFADLAAERNVLQDRVFPRLRAQCERRGARLEPIDLRWGVPPEAGQDHRTMSICLDEIRRCQQTTERPNFLIMLGRRYGWRPLPAEVPVADFDALMAAIASRADAHAVASLYPLVDDNAVPPVRCLRARTRDDENWNRTERDVLRALASATEELGWSDSKRALFGGSATEQEIFSGLFAEGIAASAQAHVHAFFTHGAPAAAPATEVDTEPAPVEARLADLKRRLCATLGPNVHEYTASDDASLDRFAEEAYASLAVTIEGVLDQARDREPLDLEVEGHDTFRRERERVFVGRQSVLARVADYLNADRARAFALLGRSGSGKSSVMARAVSDAVKAHPRAVVVTRFIGATAESSSGVTLLDGLTRQIARSYGETVPVAFAEYPRVVHAFRTLLARATTDRPLVLFIDALDQWASADPARGLSWLPLDELPPHVHIVVSASSDAAGPADLLTRKLDLEHRAVVSPMPNDDAAELLAQWLAGAGRDLSASQRRLVLSGFTTSGLPLYLRLLFEDARLWRSFEEPAPPPADLLTIVERTFDRLSEAANHGDLLVGRSLAYLAAAKEGLTESEMLDVLSADVEVMADFRARSPLSPLTSQLPLVVWSRFYYDIRAYLTERGGSGGAVLNYFHRQLREVAERRYLVADGRGERHAALAHYFASQETTRGPGVYNARKLSELPYQQRKSGMWNALEATLCDLTFIEAKCAAGLIHDLLADYNAALLTPELPEPSKQKIADFARFVRAQAHLLSSHPELTLQQALNDPDTTAPARAAQARASSDSRPRLAWIGKPQDRSPCVLTLFGHTNYVNCCEVAPDGARVASGSSDEEIKLWDPVTGKEALTLRGQRATAEGCSFSPDGRRLASGSAAGQVKVWDTQTGEELWCVSVHERAVPSARFSHDGATVVSASWDGMLKLLDANDGAERRSIAAHDRACWAEFSADDTGIISVGGDGKLRWWEAASGRELRAVDAHSHEIMVARFSPDSTSIFTASQDCLVKRWDAATLEERARYEGHDSGVWALAVSPDGTRLVTAGRDGVIKLWDVDSGDELASLHDHTNEVWGLNFFPDGRRFVSAAWDWTVRVWDLALAEALTRERTLLRAPRADQPSLWGYTIALACAPNGSSYAAGSSDGSLRLWDARSGRPLGVHALHRDFVFCCAYSPDSRFIASGAWDGAIKIFDPEAHRETAADNLGDNTVTFCGFTSDGRQLVACSNKELRVWDFEAGGLRDRQQWTADEGLKNCALIPGGTRVAVALESGRLIVRDLASAETNEELGVHADIRMMAVSRDARQLAVTTGAGVVHVWDLERRAEIVTLEGHSAAVVAANFSPDGARLVSAALDGTARVWELDVPDAVRVLDGHTDQLQDACFTPDGTRIVTAGVDETVRLWDAASATAAGQLIWPANAATVCVFGPDGRELVTASHRYAARVWSGETGTLLRELSAHGDAIRACSFSPSGELATASADGTLRVWDPRSTTPRSWVGAHDAPVSACVFAPDGTWVASASQDRLVKLWDPGTGELVATLAGHEDWIRNMLVTADGNRLVTCSVDGVVVVWDVRSRTLECSFRAHRVAPSAAAISRDGRRLAVAAEDGAMSVFDIGTGRMRAALSGHRGSISGCAFAGVFVSAGRDGTVRLWDEDTGNCRSVIEAHHGPITAMALSPDDTLLATTSIDRFARLWDLSTARSHSEYWVGVATHSVSFEPKGRRLAVGDEAGGAYLLERQSMAVRSFPTSSR